MKKLYLTYNIDDLRITIQKYIELKCMGEDHDEAGLWIVL